MFDSTSSPMSSMSIPSSSIRIFRTRLIPSSVPFRQNQISSKPLIPLSLSLFRPITFQRLPTKPRSSPSAPPPSSIPSSLQPIEELPLKLQEIINLFQAVQEPKAKYEQLLFYGRNLSPLDDQYKTKENKVEGCVSQVWVRAVLDPDKNIWFEADSDSVLTKGLAALLVQGLSGRPVTDILRVSPDFITLLGLQQSLTPSRNNGFLNMLKLMQKKALLLAVEAEKAAAESGVEANVPNSDDLSSNRANGTSSRVAEGSKSGSKYDGEYTGTGVELNGSESADVQLGSRGERIRDKLERELKPIQLDVEDISYQHAGHAAVRGSGDGETHFNLRVVSKEFEGKSLVKRHRLIYDLLQDELQGGLHALSIIAKTPSEI